MRLVFDIESDGLLDTITKVHCLVLRDADTGALVGDFADHDGHRPLREGMDILRKADLIIGHNVLKFDCPALEKIYPGYRLDRAKVRDTLLLGRVLWPELKPGDFVRFKKGEMPGQLIGGHGLEAWGYRFEVRKGEYTDWCKEHGIADPWASWCPEMHEYCINDTLVNHRLWRMIVKKDLDERCVELEHDAALLCMKITENGFPFNEAEAAILYNRILTDKEEVTQQLRVAFPQVEIAKTFIPKATNKRYGYVKGVPFTKVRLHDFNPGSREEITERLKAKYGWKPTVFTEDSQTKADMAKRKGDPKWEDLLTPQVDETILEGLPYPEAPLLADYFLLDKRAGAMASKKGEKGWLQLVDANGLIHGEYATAGTVTGRATHSRPNMSQITKKCPRYGHVFRELFGVLPGWALVGVDMSGLELRCFGHYLGRFDGGTYVDIVTKGDVHAAHREAMGLLEWIPDPKDARDGGKTVTYGYLYGAGDWKIGHSIATAVGSIVGGIDDAEKVRIGRLVKSRIESRLPGLAELKKAVLAAIVARGHLIGLDGRPLTIRKKHAALNMLLQSAGAILCKRWITQVEKALLARGLRHGWDGDFAFLAWAHDELQIAVRNEEIGKIVAEIAIAETKAAGEFFDFRCPLTGEAKFGTNWSQTH